MKTPALVLTLAFSSLPLLAQSIIPNNPGTRETVAITNATIYPVTAAPIPNGTIVFSDGIISAVGAGITIPGGARVIDGSGLSVYPGLIDSGTRVGLTEVSSVRGTNDVSETGDINPHARVAVALNPHSNVIPVTRANGITYVVSRPQGGLISGQSALIRLAGWTPQEMTVRDSLAMHISFPEVRVPSVARTEEEREEREARRTYDRQLDRLRETFRDARAYSRALAARRDGTTTARLDPNLRLESMVPVVEGVIPVVIHANRAADIRAALSFAEEMEVRMILSGGADVQQVIPELRRRNTDVILGPIWSLPLREDDPYDTIFANAAALHQAGIRFAIQTNDAHNVRNLPYQVASAAAHGLPREEALRSITIRPAEIFGVADRIGSLEAGKAASLIVTNGDPLEIPTRIHHLFIDGEEISLDTYHSLQYQKFLGRPAQ
jgi:imidazolonepropionase-like amidohydrolase